MANDPMGNNFIEGPLGVVLLNFNSVDLGKTLDDAEIRWIEDVKDIFYAQDGTQPADKVPTGQAYELTCTLAEQTWARMKELMRGLTVSGNNVKLGVDLYRSGYNNFAKALTVTRVDSDGAASTDPKYRLYFYKAMPIVNGAIGNFGPDSQRSMEVTFYMFKDRIKGAFGYEGYASSLGL